MITIVLCVTVYKRGAWALWFVLGRSYVSLCEFSDVFPSNGSGRKHEITAYGKTNLKPDKESQLRLSTFSSVGLQQTPSE